MKNFHLEGSVLRYPFSKILLQLDKPQLVPFSLVHFFFGMLNQIRKALAGCTIGMVSLAGGEAMPTAAKSNSQLAENYTKPK